MDGTRRRRTRDNTRQGWYARWRCARFARRLGFVPPDAGAAGAEALSCGVPGGLPACPSWCRSEAWAWDNMAQGLQPMVWAGGWFFHAVQVGLILTPFLWASLAWRSSECLFRQRAA